MQTLTLHTRQRRTLLDITQDIEQIISQAEWKEGAVLLFCPHTTAGLTVNEGADPDVRVDLLRRLERLAPVDPQDRHSEGNSDAHLQASLMGPSLLLPLDRGRLALGTWQAVYFCEFDGPRQRTLRLTHLAIAAGP